VSRKFNLYNFNFFSAEDFQPFTVDGYTFSPTPERQPQNGIIFSPEDELKFNRRMSLNAKVSIPARQRNSVFRKGGVYTGNRKIKFLEDLLNVISICIGRNVVPKFHKKRHEFPLCSAKHCDLISKNSTELEIDLNIVAPRILDLDWQRKYDNGFHVRKFYNSSDIFVLEPRFLADITIWEYLYSCNHRDMPYGRLNRVTLNTKINYLIKTYLLTTVSAIPEEQFRIFSDLRNQLSHNGKLPIQNPSSPHLNLAWAASKKYMILFRRLTQALVLKTIGIDALHRIDTLMIRTHLNELLTTGAVSSY
jgi:hypothetical protein